MWTFVAIAVIGGALILLLVRAVLIGRRQGHEPEPVAIDPSHADEFPEPGEPSPHRPDGRPIPGSRDDRATKRNDEG